MDDASSRPFLPEGRLAELFAGPQQLNRHERRAIADAALSWLRAEFGADLVAVALYGSTAQQNDGPYSDVELWAALEDHAAGAARRLEWVWGPGKLEIELMSVSQVITAAARVDERWPRVQGRFAFAVPIHEAERQAGFVERIRTAAADLPDATRRLAMAECVLELYELLGKLRNARLGGAPTEVARHAIGFAEQAACLLALQHRHIFTSGRGMFLEAYKLEGPEPLKTLIGRLMHGLLAPPAEVIDHCEQVWAALPAWTRAMGLDLAGCVRPGPSPAGPATPGELEDWPETPAPRAFAPAPAQRPREQRRAFG